MLELMPAEVLLILRIAGLQPTSDIYVDPLLLDNLSQSELEQAFAGLVRQELVQSSPGGGLSLAPDVAANADAMLHPQASLGLTIQRSLDDARAMFVNFGPHGVLANHITSEQRYRLDPIALRVDAVVSHLLEYLEANDTGYATRIVDLAHIDWTQLADEANVFEALLGAATRSGLAEAGKARDEMRGGTLVTLRVFNLERQAARVETLLWVEKIGFRWLMRGVEGDSDMTLLRLNGPALRAVLAEVVTPMVSRLE